VTSREFVNEFGNSIRITVARGAPDPDAVCTTCRWRGVHKPGCAVRGWPEVPFAGGGVLFRVEGPSSVSENMLTPVEAAQLFAAYVECMREVA
jgi:hypothetical protein